MVAALDRVDRGARAERRQVRRELLRAAEVVARALDDQQRRPQRGEVRDAQLLRPAWRVQRIAERDDAGDRMRDRRGAGVRGAATIVAMRPPIDLPPITSRRPSSQPRSASVAISVR